MCPSQRWARCCTASVWAWCWITLTLKLNTLLTASPSCSRLPHPCCTYLLVCWGRLEQRCGGTTWRLGMGYLTKARQWDSQGQHWKFHSSYSCYVSYKSHSQFHPIMVWFYLFIFQFFGASADRCIQNIYRQLRQETETSNKYPGVLASLLMLDKLSIEDIKASVTELMAGGVDTVRRRKNKKCTEILLSRLLSTVLRPLCVS